MIPDDYKRKTTFWSDFTIAEPYGVSALMDTYKRGLLYAKTDYEAFTELVMILNWKIWDHFEAGNMPLAKAYNNLWLKSQADYNNTFKSNKEAMHYYYETTD